MDYSDEKLVKPYLTTKKLVPENQESPLHFLDENITPEKYLYRRNHFLYPVLTEQAYTLPIGGEVKRPTLFYYQDLLSMPSKTIAMVLECSGNKRSYFDPKVYGEQWKDGAISQGEWKGVPLKDLLEITGLNSSATEVVFEGYDCGKLPDVEEIISFARSLPMSKALHPDTLIAYEYNGKSIPYRNGYPLRLIVPQWYGMASVKWLKRIAVIDYEFKGPFQAVEYVYYPYKYSDKDKKPVTTINVNSTILKPLDHSIIDEGGHKIEGIAWTGKGQITDVEISFDKGETWEKAKLHKDPSSPYPWIKWSYIWNAHIRGEYTIMSRAKDSHERIQPHEAMWNRKGYGYNAIYEIKVKVE